MLTALTRARSRELRDQRRSCARRSEFERRRRIELADMWINTFRDKKRGEDVSRSMLTTVPIDKGDVLRDSRQTHPSLDRSARYRSREVNLLGMEKCAYNERGLEQPEEGCRRSRNPVRSFP